MTALEEILEKKLNNMSHIELAIWYTFSGTTAYNMDAAAHELAALRKVAEEAMKLKLTLEEGILEKSHTLYSALRELDEITKG